MSIARERHLGRRQSRGCTRSAASASSRADSLRPSISDACARMTSASGRDVPASSMTSSALSGCARRSATSARTSRGVSRPAARSRAWPRARPRRARRRRRTLAPAPRTAARRRRGACAAACARSRRAAVDVALLQLQLGEPEVGARQLPRRRVEHQLADDAFERAARRVAIGAALDLQQRAVDDGGDVVGVVVERAAIGLERAIVAMRRRLGQAEPVQHERIVRIAVGGGAQRVGGGVGPLEQQLGAADEIRRRGVGEFAAQRLRQPRGAIELAACAIAR